jgi:AcrR family transcriptional regulator
MWEDALMPRVPRATSQARTRQRILDQAERLFRERGYAATSLEQIAEAAEVTKGAIYGHFANKEDLLLSAIEAAPTPDYALLNDNTVPVRRRLRDFGRTLALDEAATDRASLAAYLEFLAALLRNPKPRDRYAADLRRRLAELADADRDQPGGDTTTIEAWAIGHALSTGLQLYRVLAPDLFTPDLVARATELLADLYPDGAEVDRTTDS